MKILTQEEYEHKKAMLRKAGILRNKVDEVLMRVQKQNIDKAIDLEDMISAYRRNIIVKNPDIRGNDEKIEIAMIPIYETICNLEA